MICIFVILLTGWCRMRMRPARLVSYAFLYTAKGFTILTRILFDLIAKIFVEEHFFVSERFWYRKSSFKRGGFTISRRKSFVSKYRKFLKRHLSPSGVCEYLTVLIIDCTYMLQIIMPGKKTD